MITHAEIEFMIGFFLFAAALALWER